VLALLAECLEAAAVLSDRMAGHWRATTVADVVVPHPDYVLFALRSGFRPDFCEAHDPQSKGVVEPGGRLVRAGERPHARGDLRGAGGAARARAGGAAASAALHANGTAAKADPSALPGWRGAFARRHLGINTGPSFAERPLGMLLNTISGRPARALAAYDGR
jgi:hypothetical protein